MGCFLLCPHPVVSPVLQARCTLPQLELNPWGKPGLVSLAELSKGCAPSLPMAKGTPRWVLFLWTSFHQGKKGKSPSQVAAKSWKNPFPYPPLWRRQAGARCEDSLIASIRLMEALLQKKTPFLCKERGARTQKGMFPAARLERPAGLWGGGGCGRDGG